MDEPAIALHPPEARLLEGRTAVVSGATSGIGAAVVRELAAHGAGVAIGYRSDPEAAGRVADALVALGRRAVPVRMDVSDEAEVTRAFAEARDALGAVDLVVANAGREAARPLVEMTLADWDDVIGTNLTGTFLCCREGARHMLEHGRGGTIVGVTSVHDRMPWRHFSHYAASKGGQRLFLESIAKELAPAGVRVVAVAPGAVATPINEEMLADDAARAAVEAQIPAARIGEPAEIARAVAWMASDRASYVTGATLVVDGGMTLFPPDAG
jgi:glucose 1-dehydrogenase